MLAKVLIRLIGEEQVVAMPVNDLDKSRFSLAGLLGKRLFIDDDVKSGSRLPDGQLKRISEEKAVTAEHKFGPQFTFEIRAMVMLLCNAPPSLADLSHGMQRRLFVVPFDRKFLESEDDRQLLSKICAAELPGILYRLLEGLRRVISRGWRIDRPDDVKRATAEWLIEANPVPAFVDSWCEPDSGSSVWMRELYEAFCQWAKGAGITQPQQQSTFRRNLENLKFNVRHGNKGDKVVGLKLVRRA
jgi:P4 family phage/plasmid primase-like protien